MSTNDYIIPLSEIIARFPGHVFWKDCRGVYCGCNAELALSIGLKSIDDLVGKTDFDIVSQDEANRLRDIDLYVIETGETHIVEEAVILQGESRVYVSKKAPLRNAAGQVVGVIGTAVDITKRKQAEKAMLEAMQASEHANQVKDEFIANMSHDLRTPLSGIQALAENMQLLNNDPILANDISMMLNASADLLRLIDSILDVVRTDAGVYACVEHPFRLLPLVINSINIMLPKIKEKQLDFTYDCDEALPQNLIGQSLMLQRIILNILGNAIKFTDQAGKVKLSLKLESKTAEKCIILLKVEDSGIGIPLDKIDTIFEKFSRISESFRGQYKGTGVGLYMVKQYIDKMGGVISVSSDEKSGTTFSCSIPFSFSDEAVQGGLPQQMVQSPDKQYRDVNVLLVEDNIIAQHSQSAKFQTMGCSVDIAGNAKMALELFKQKKFNLLVVDLGLPDLDGWALARAFRASHSNPNSLAPILVLTAHADINDVSEKYADELSTVIFRRKPLMLEDVKSVLHMFIV